jgi:hypothetical protein
MYTPLRRIGEWRYNHSFLTPFGCQWVASHLGLFTLREITPGVHFVESRGGLDVLEKRKTSYPLPGFETCIALAVA